MAQMKEQIKAPKKELSHEERANLSDEQFKTLIIRMLTEMTEYSWKIKEEVKAIWREIKENVQKTNSQGKETGTQINDLEQKEEINIQQEQNEETRILKNKERFRNTQDHIKHSNIWIIGVPEGEEEEQEIENLFEKNNERKLPQSGEGNRHISPGSSESPKQVGSKEEHTKMHHNYITQD